MDLSRSRLEKLIDEYIFSERNRRIMKRFWLDDITYEAIAEEEEMSPRQIPNIVKECELILVKYM